MSKLNTTFPNRDKYAVIVSLDHKLRGRIQKIMAYYPTEKEAVRAIKQWHKDHPQSKRELIIMPVDR